MTALLFTLLALSIWLHQDATRRQMQSPLAWVAVLWILGPLALAAYWARRPLFAGEARVGGTGWVLARSFVTALTAWVVLIAAVFCIWLSAYLPWVMVLALLATVGVLLAGTWCFVVAGLLLVAWLLRDGDDIERGPTHAALAGQGRPYPGDRLLRVIFLGGLAAVFIFTEPVHPHWVESVEWQTLPERWSL